MLDLCGTGIKQLGSHRTRVGQAGMLDQLLQPVALDDFHVII